MSHQHERTEILLGQQGLDFLRNQHVLIAGVGGVGGAAAEAVCRAGVGKITLLDHDDIALSNLNRQLVSLHSNIGQLKAEEMGRRLLDINPDLQLTILTEFMTVERAATLVSQGGYDYVLDCIDSIACKAELVMQCLRHGVPVASSMGAGGRLDVSKIKVGPLAKTEICPLARQMRIRLRKAGVTMRYPVVYSTEVPIKALPHAPVGGGDAPEGRPRAVNGTISYMPNLFGFTLAGYAIKQMLDQR